MSTEEKDREWRRICVHLASIIIKIDEKKIVSADEIKEAIRKFEALYKREICDALKDGLQ